MDVFTSITLNYLPKARILAKTLKAFHPNWNFHLLINERATIQNVQKINSPHDRFFDQVIWIKDLTIPEIDSWIFKHTVVELCTAVKGPYLHHLAQSGSKKIMYIDPDIAIFNDLSPLEEMLDNHGILLAPHLLDFTDNPQSIHDNEIAGTLRHGTFNLGFIAINADRPDAQRFSDWWHKRLLDYCYADYDQGLFTDQKWCDLIPSFFNDYHIIRDPGYDVASWNLDCRQVSISKEGQLLVNEKFHLRFYHFTGYDSGAGMNVINHLTSKGDNSIILELWDWYNRQLLENEQELWGQKACSYDRFENGEKITTDMRKIYRTRPDLQKQFKNPFVTDGGTSHFYEWWQNEFRQQPNHLIDENHSQIKQSLPGDAFQHAYTELVKNQAIVYSQLLGSEQNQPANEFVPLSKDSLVGRTTKIKPIAFYLPQFHPIPENDQWWGKGFTEWTNVTRAVPQFPGHYQPRLPGELGFYDLRLKETQLRQIELAKQYGIYGFAFYYYWFSGKKLLDLPINRFLANKEIDFPFCLIWANENWTRRWDGMDHDILMAQVHSPEMDAAFIRDLEPYLRDERYIRIGDRPIIMVYRVDIMPKPIETASIWREFCIKNHLGDPYLIAAQTFGFQDPRQVGFDAAVQFPPHNELHSPQFHANQNYKLTNPDSSLLIFSYPEVVKYKQNNPVNVPYNLFQSIIPSWDNEPRKPGRSTIYADSSPELYRKWLQTICDWTLRHNSPDERYIFINAWNEWAEGAYLEPDRRYGYAYLQATMDVLRAL